MIPELANLLRSSVEECLEDKVAVSFSGGVDSSLIAHIAKSQCEVYLFSSGTENSQDSEYAKIVANELNLSYENILLDNDSILNLYEELYKIIPASLLKIEILLPIYTCAKRAGEKGLEVMLTGSGSEELFVGYNRYYTYLEEGKDLDSILKKEFRNLCKGDSGMISKVLRAANIEARHPFLNKKLADYVFSIPLEKRIEDKELKKGLIREAAKLLKLPEIAVKRKKKAAQYGSNFVKGIDKLAKKYDFNTKKEYLQSLLHP